MEKSILDHMLTDAFAPKKEQEPPLAWLEADQLIKEGVKSASLFMRGKVGLAASAGLFLLDEIKPCAKGDLGTKIVDGGLGALKGSLLHFSFNGLQSFPGLARIARENGVSNLLRKGLTADPLLKYFPEKLNLPARAMGMGIASSVIESSCSRNTWLNREGKFDALHGTSEIANRSASLPALLGYAGVFGAGHVLSKGVNRITNGLLERNSMAAASTMNASVGLVTGGLQEIGRENEHAENLDAGKIVAKSLLNAGISAIAAAPGALHAERQVMGELSVKPGQKKIEIEEVSKDKVSLMTCADEPEPLVQFFSKNGEPGKPCGLDVDANYYRIKGLDTTIVVPQAKGRQSFAGSLNETLSTVAQVLRELPNASQIKEVHLYDMCAYPRYAEASSTHRIRLYVGSNKYDFARNLRHEGGHIQDYAQPGLNKKFSLTADKEDAYDAGWNPAEGGFLDHAQSDAAENLASLSERLQARDGRHFIECLLDGKAPLRSIVYGQALEAAARENNALDSAYRRRMDIIAEYAKPRQAEALKRSIEADIAKVKDMTEAMSRDDQKVKKPVLDEILNSVVDDPARDLQILESVGSIKDLVFVEKMLREAGLNKRLVEQAFKTGMELAKGSALDKAKFIHECLREHAAIDLTEQRKAIVWLREAVESGKISGKFRESTIDPWYLKNQDKIGPNFILEWLASQPAASLRTAYKQAFDSAKARYVQQATLFQNCHELINKLESRFTQE